MDFFDFHTILLIIQKSISCAGVFVILIGVLVALSQYVLFVLTPSKKKPILDLNGIRLRLSRMLVLGLEFIVAADLIGTTTAPDYYSVGIVASIVAIRTVLNFTLNREIATLTKEEKASSKS
jgi:uncharacterized membrane protein